MVVSTPPEYNNKCTQCQELRELPLHLYELSLYADFLGNEFDVFRRKKGQRVLDGTAKTKTIGNWLRLAAQLDSVVLDTYIYQDAHIYCEPVAGMLASEAAHQEAIITPLTKFVFVCNALEECYRLMSGLYERAFEEDVIRKLRPEYLRDYSMQGACLLVKYSDGIALPEHYTHLVENLRKIALRYSLQFKGRFSVGLDCVGQIDYGLALVRNLRNHVAHGVFPIVDDPEYSFPSTADMKRNLVNFLNQSTRVAALNIQMMIALVSDDFHSDQYWQLANDDEYGKNFLPKCTAAYLRDLHRRQAFGLNERDLWESIRAEELV